MSARECPCGERLSWWRWKWCGWCKGCIYRMQMGGAPRRRKEQQ